MRALLYEAQVVKRNKEPRLVGGKYFSGYWGKAYRVISISRAGFFTVRWEDGQITSHCTPWDTQRDLVITSGGPDIAL